MPKCTRLIKLSVRKELTTLGNNSYVLSFLNVYIKMEYHSKHNYNRQNSEKKCVKV